MTNKLSMQRAADITDIIDDIRKSGGDVVTYPYPELVKYQRRLERFPVFCTRMKEALEIQGYLVAFGRTTVVVVSDFNFSPVK